MFNTETDFDDIDDHNVYAENGYEYFRMNGKVLTARKETDAYRVDFTIDEERNIVTEKQTVFKLPYEDSFFVISVDRKYQDEDSKTKYLKGGWYITQPTFWLLKNVNNVKATRLDKVILSLFKANDDVGEKLPDPIAGRPTEVPYW